MIEESEFNELEFELLTDLGNIKPTIVSYSKEMERYPSEIHKVVCIIDNKVVIVNSREIKVLRQEAIPLSKNFIADDYICERFDKWKKVEQKLLHDSKTLQEFCDFGIRSDEEHIENEVRKILDTNAEYFTFEAVKEILNNVERFRKEQDEKRQEAEKKEQKTREEIYNTTGEYTDDSRGYSNVKITGNTLMSGGDVIAVADKPFKDLLPFDFWETNLREIGSMKFFSEMIKETKEAKFTIKPHFSKTDIVIERKEKKAEYLGKTIPLSKVYFVMNNRESIKSADDISKWVKLPKTMIELLERTSITIDSKDYSYGREGIKCDISFSLIDKDNIKIDFLTYSNIVSWENIQKYFIQGRYIKSNKSWYEMMGIMGITNKQEYFEVLKKAKVLQSLKGDTDDEN